MLVDTLRGILAGTIQTREHLQHVQNEDPLMMPVMDDILRARNQNGVEGFWSVFDAYSAILIDWKPFMVVAQKPAEIKPPQEEKKKEEASIQRKLMAAFGLQRDLLSSMVSTLAPGPSEAQIADGQKARKNFRAGRLMAQIQSETVHWLWQDHVPLGAITIVEGDPGLGKSLLTLDLAARVSRGAEMPDGTPGLQGGVILIHPEDEAGMTVKPRLERQKACMEQILSLCMVPDVEKAGRERPFALSDDIAILEQVIRELGARLLIIDPMMAVLKQHDIYRDNAVRGLLLPLQELVERTRIACVLVRHLNKGNGDKAIYRGGGSIAFTALARTLFSVQMDPYDREKRVLSCVKNNLGPMNSSLSFSIESIAEDTPPSLLWHGKCSYNANELYRLNDSPASNQGGNRQEILNILKEAYPNALKVEQIGEKLPDVSRNALKAMLTRMEEVRQIERVSRGLYKSIPA
jgi:hypothetical protein